MSKCEIDGIKYDHVPTYKGERAFLDDGSPNPSFDWDGWQAEAAARQDKAKNVR